MPLLPSSKTELVANKLGIHCTGKTDCEYKHGACKDGVCACQNDFFPDTSDLSCSKWICLHITVCHVCLCCAASTFVEFLWLCF